jgi:presqualene diphosphate synthase
MAEIAAEETAAEHRASGSSFYAAMRVLPRARRDAIYEIYGFCRAVDDVADAHGPREPRLAELARWRADVDALYAGGPGAPGAPPAPPARVRGLAEPVRRYALAREDFQEIIAGMEMDVVADIRAPDWATLDRYCDRVASAVGRLCVKIFGMEDEAGAALAHHLGRALQLTNILRDLDEDAERGRLYLPREALESAGIGIADPPLVLLHPGLSAACARVIERAENHFRAADAIMDRAPRKEVRAPRLMAEVYKRILARLATRGFGAPRASVRLTKPLLLWLVLRHALL